MSRIAAPNDFSSAGGTLPRAAIRHCICRLAMHRLTRGSSAGSCMICPATPLRYSRRGLTMFVITWSRASVGRSISRAISR